MAGLIYVMEELDEDLDVDSAAAEEVAATVADESAVVQSDADEIGTTVGQIEDAIQEGDELEAIGEVAAEAAESGEGLDENAAEVAAIAIERARARLGFSDHRRVTPARESFGNSSTRLHSTHLVIESVMDTIKSIWLSIKKAAIRLWDKIKTFFLGLFKSTEGLVKHLKGLKDRLRKLPSDTKVDKKLIDNNGLARALTVKGKANIDSFTTIVENTLKLSVLSKTMVDYGKNIAVAAIEVSKSEFDNDTVVEKFMGQWGSLSAHALTNGFKGMDTLEASYAQNIVPPKKKPKAGAKVQHRYYGPFVGNTVIAVTETDEATGGKRLEYSFQGSPAKDAKKVEALDPSECNKVLEASMGLAASLNDYKAIQGDIDSLTKKISGLADDVIRTAEKALKATGSKTTTRLGLDALKTVVNDTISAMNSVSAKAPSLTFNLAKVGADYVSASLRNLKG